MYEALLKATPEYQKVAASFGSAGPAALFGLPPAGRALLYAALQKDLDRVLCIVTPGEAEATHFADDLKALGLTAAVFPPRDFMLRPVRVQAASTSTAAFRCWAHWRAGGCRPSACPPKRFCSTPCPGQNSSRTPSP